MKKLVLFDLDGVLLDSRTNMEQAWAEVREKTGLDIPFSDYFPLIGRPFRDILGCLGVTTDLTRIEETYMAASLYFLSNAAFYPQTEKALALLQRNGKTLGIVTSKDPVRTKAVLSQLAADFKVIQCPASPYRGKPAPDHLLLAMAETQIDPADTVFIGDMETDHQAAVRAGIDYIHASWGYGPAILGIKSIKSIRLLAEHLI